MNIGLKPNFVFHMVPDREGNVSSSIAILFDNTVTVASLPQFSITLPKPTAQQLFLSISTPDASGPLYNQGAANVDGATVTFAASDGPFTFQAGQQYTIAILSENS
jgi:hypothetical protein